MARRPDPSLEPPKRACSDKKCPYHGDVSVRGKYIIGKVVSTKMTNTVIVLREYLKYDRKYMRYERRRSRIPAHSPPCLDIKEGDIVKIGECRPLSKTVHFVVLGKVRSDVG
ncbi:30S ribosomal protein S17 [Candidatus Bathyarchaeota archaeon ex4484_205]|nr:MAG: 30S ribosomal protein S17 [Candidatus Bathyarchaeota archaeon ex4484_205]